MLKKIFFLLCLLNVQSLLAQPAAPEKVLFIGNSYTYFWNLPQTVNLMAEAKEIELITRQSTVGGSNLGQHWRGARDAKSVGILENGDFDAVVLQDHSMRAIDAPDSLMFYGGKFAELAKNKGAKVYVYMTWSREWAPEKQKIITKQYKKLAKKIDATVVPVGLAWKKIRADYPDMKLFDPDGSHPSPLGTYLNACVFFSVFTGESPVGLPNRLITTDKDGEKLYLTIQSKDDAAICQKVAEEVVKSFAK